MSIETNKALVQRFFQHISDREIGALAELMHPDFTWSIPFRADQFPFAGVRDGKAVREMLAGFLGGFTEFRFEVLGMTAEGKHVAVEAKSQGRGPGSATYENVYHIHVEIRDDRLHAIREFFDPYQVMAYVAQLPG